MKKEKLLMIAVLFCSIWSAACGIGGSNTKDDKTNQSKTSAPAIKISAEELTKEWKANPAATNEKYDGKNVEISGGTNNVEISGDSAVIQMDGDGAKIFCNVETTDGTDKLKKMLDDSRVPKPIKMTVKGVYQKGSADKSAVEIKPCEPPYLFQ